MDTVRIEDFPSSTNFVNFKHDLEDQMPGLWWEQDGENEVILISLDDYESTRDQITELVRQAGAVAFRPKINNENT